MAEEEKIELGISGRDDGFSKVLQDYTSKLKTINHELGKMRGLQGQLFGTSPSGRISRNRVDPFVTGARPIPSAMGSFVDPSHKARINEANRMAAAQKHVESVRLRAEQKAARTARYEAIRDLQQRQAAMATSVANRAFAYTPPPPIRPQAQRYAFSDVMREYRGLEARGAAIVTGSVSRPARVDRVTGQYYPAENRPEMLGGYLDRALHRQSLMGREARGNFLASSHLRSARQEVKVDRLNSPLLQSLREEAYTGLRIRSDRHTAGRSMLAQAYRPARALQGSANNILDFLGKNEGALNFLGLGGAASKAGSLAGIARFAPQALGLVAKNPWTAAAGLAAYGTYKAGGAAFNLGKDGVGQMISGLVSPFQTLSRATTGLISSFLVFSGVMYGLNFIIQRVLSVAEKTLDEAFAPITDRYRIAGLMGTSLEEAGGVQRHWMGLAAGAYSEYNAIGGQAYRIMNAAPDFYKDPAQAGGLMALLSMTGTISGSTEQELSSSIMQLSQAIAANRLQGDEWRSVRENLPMMQRFLKNYMESIGRRESLNDLTKAGLIGRAEIHNAIAMHQEEIMERFRKMPLNPDRIRSIYKLQEQHAMIRGGKMLTDFADSPYQDKATRDIQMIAQKGADIRLALLGGLIDMYKFFSDHRSEIENWLKNLGRFALDSFERFAPAIGSALWGALTWGAGQLTHNLNMGAAKTQASLGFFSPVAGSGEWIRKEHKNRGYFQQQYPSYFTDSFQKFDYFGNSARFLGQSIASPLSIAQTNVGMNDVFQSAATSLVAFIKEAGSAERNRDTLYGRALELVDNVWKAADKVFEGIKEVIKQILLSVKNATVTMLDVMASVLQVTRGIISFLPALTKEQRLNKFAAMAGIQGGIDSINGVKGVKEGFKSNIETGYNNAVNFINQQKLPESNSTKASIADGITNAIMTITQPFAGLDKVDPNIQKMASDTSEINQKMSSIETILMDMTRETGLRQVANFGTARRTDEDSYSNPLGIHRPKSSIYTQMNNSPSYVVAEGYN